MSLDDIYDEEAPSGVADEAEAWLASRRRSDALCMWATVALFAAGTVVWVAETVQAIWRAL